MVFREQPPDPIDPKHRRKRYSRKVKLSKVISIVLKFKYILKKKAMMRRMALSKYTIKTLYNAMHDKLAYDKKEFVQDLWDRKEAFDYGECPFEEEYLDHTTFEEIELGDGHVYKGEVQNNPNQSLENSKAMLKVSGAPLFSSELADTQTSSLATGRVKTKGFKNIK